LLASVPYRKSLNFTFDGLKSAQTAIERLRNFKFRLDSAKLATGANAKIDDLAAKAAADFVAALNDDLNTAEALAAVFEFIREANIALDTGEFLDGNVGSAQALLDRFDSFFDVLRPDAAAGGLSDEVVEARVAERTAAKKARDFARADRVRAELLQEGIILEDTKDGIRWKRK